MNESPRLIAPQGSCDCHMHIFNSRFPLSKNARKQEPDASVAEYQEMQKRLGLDRVVVVQPTAYGVDNRCTLEAMAEFGDSARGVAVVDQAVTDAELESLSKAGIRGVRFRMMDNPELPWEQLPGMASRIAELGWHLQFQMDGRKFHEREDFLKQIKCPLVIEHIGKFLEPVPVEHEGFRSLQRLLDTGNCWVKLSGAYMLSLTGPPLYEDIGVLAKELVKTAPERLVWASNWPHPLPSGALPDDAELLDLLLDWAESTEVRNKILVSNPAKLYGFN